jgi:hypothetical protein
MTASKTTRDHAAIRKWAQKRGGHPTSVRGTERGEEAAGVLRFDFGVKDEKLHPVDWDAFFHKFEARKLGVPLSGRDRRREDEPVPQVHSPPLTAGGGARLRCSRARPDPAIALTDRT